MGVINDLMGGLRNLVMNWTGVKRDLGELIADKDISKALDLFENNDSDIELAIKEYDPTQHDIMKRPDKPRKNRNDYVTQKLPRNWQGYINEIALFFLFAKPVRWINRDESGKTNEEFKIFTDFLNDTRFNTTMRQAKRMAGAETRSAKLYHLYKDSENKPHCKVIVLSRTTGYRLKPLFDQYKKLIAFAVGYYLKESDMTVEHWDIYTEDFIHKCAMGKLGWTVTTSDNQLKMIPIIYYEQEKEWARAQIRITRDEYLDSKTADINEYFADPIAAATADVISKLADPEAIGKMIQYKDDKSKFEYINPPTSLEMKESEKKVLRESIHQDTFTPDFSFKEMVGMGTLSGEAIKRAMILGYIKRDNSKEIYEIAIDREKNLVLAIIDTLFAPGKEIKSLNIGFELAEPFDEDFSTRVEDIASAVEAGILSVERGVTMLGVASDVAAELAKIKAMKDAVPKPV